MDLDGVLAQYDGWKGLDITGAPNPGAVEFMRALSEIAEVVVYTTRCTVEAHREELREPTRPASDLAPRLVHSVRYWLEKHRFAFDDVFAGQGKPLASAYVDDRAVACTPQKDAQAFANALQRVRDLCASRREDSPKPPDEKLKSVMERWQALPESVQDEIATLARGGSGAKPRSAKKKKK